MNPAMRGAGMDKLEKFKLRFEGFVNMSPAKNHTNEENK